MQLQISPDLKELKAPAAKLFVLEAEQENTKVVECPRCGFEMKNMTACHMICTNCGSHMDCSDKGLTW